jgi:hypothetical protein
MRAAPSLNPCPCAHRHQCILAHYASCSPTSATAACLSKHLVASAVCCCCLQGQDPRVLKAASEVTLRGLAKITLLGDPVAVSAEAKKLGADISNCRVVDPKVRQAVPCLCNCVCCLPHAFIAWPCRCFVDAARGEGVQLQPSQTRWCYCSVGCCYCCCKITFTAARPRCVLHCAVLGAWLCWQMLLRAGPRGPSLTLGSGWHDTRRGGT